MCPRRACTRARTSSAAWARRVTTRIYPGMGHTINDDEIAWAQDLLDDLTRANEARE
jgi:predicted esterase